MTTTVRSYFQDIYDNIKSIMIGMKITLKYCFQKTVTVQYPEQRLSFAPRYRGIHEFEVERHTNGRIYAYASVPTSRYPDPETGSGVRDENKNLAKSAANERRLSKRIASSGT